MDFLIQRINEQMDTARAKNINNTTLLLLTTRTQLSRIDLGIMKSNTSNYAYFKFSFFVSVALLAGIASNIIIAAHMPNSFFQHYNTGTATQRHKSMPGTALPPGTRDKGV